MTYGRTGIETATPAPTRNGNESKCHAVLPPNISTEAAATAPSPGGMDGTEWEIWSYNYCDKCWHDRRAWRDEVYEEGCPLIVKAMNKEQEIIFDPSDYDWDKPRHVPVSISDHSKKT
jgi:hypothetical protein